MKALKNHTIAELIEVLHHRGIEWVGKTTRKAPLLALLAELGVPPLPTSVTLEMWFYRLANNQGIDLRNLVWLCKYWGINLTSDNLDYSHLVSIVIKAYHDKVKVSPEKIASTPINKLHNKPLFYLWAAYNTMGCTEVVSTLNEDATRFDLVYYLTHKIVEYNSDPRRNLKLDVEGCDCVIRANSNLPKSQQPNFINEIKSADLCAHELKSLRTRGFYEPNVIHGSDSSLYLACRVNFNRPNSGVVPLARLIAYELKYCMDYYGRVSKLPSLDKLTQYTEAIAHLIGPDLEAIPNPNINSPREVVIKQAWVDSLDYLRKLENDLGVMGYSRPLNKLLSLSANQG